ncbi:MAG: hypothetical protein AB1673_15810 [Actinomycetota bacterium]
MSSLLDSSAIEYFAASPVRTVSVTAGLLIGTVLLVLLAQREVLGAARGEHGPGRLRAADAVSLPLFVAFVAVVVVRFDQLSL